MGEGKERGGKLVIFKKTMREMRGTTRELNVKMKRRKMKVFKERNGIKIMNVDHAGKKDIFVLNALKKRET